jgi:hypothetical protein
MQAVILLPRRMTFGSTAAALVPSARLSYTSASAQFRATSCAVDSPLVTLAADANRPPALTAIEYPKGFELRSHSLPARLCWTAHGEAGIKQRRIAPAGSRDAEGPG